MTPDPVFKAFADPTRRALFERLVAQGEKSVAALTEGSGVSQPMVSKHLAVLKAAGLVSGRAMGRETHYRAEPGGLAPLAFTRIYQASHETRGIVIYAGIALVITVVALLRGR